LVGINITPEEHRPTHLSEVQTVDTDEFMSRQAVDYGFGFMARANTNNGTGPAFLGEHDSEDSDAFLDALVKECGGQELQCSYSCLSPPPTTIFYLTFQAVPAREHGTFFRKSVLSSKSSPLA